MQLTVVHMRRLRISLLGRFEVQVEDQVIPPNAWPGHKARQLLKILITHHPQTVASDQLIEWLWPHLTPASAHNSLWVAISRLRRLLEPDTVGARDLTFVVTEPPGYRFEPCGRCEIDVHTFLEAFRSGQRHQERGDWPAAVARFHAAEDVYRGDFLIEDLYEDWAISPRERLREIHLETQSSLATCYITQRRYRQALVHCHRILEQDASHESTWQLAMECYYRVGERGQALRAFERCRAFLDQELGVEPLPETITLYERILHDQMEERIPPLSASPSGAPATLPPFPFVGRDREWARFCHLLEKALRAQGQVVLLTGEPGIGKTRLLEELAGLAAARGFRVLRGRCYELEQNVAYGPIVEAVRGIIPLFRRFPRPPCPPGQMAAVAELLPKIRQVWPDLPIYRPLPADEERLRILEGLTKIIFSCAQGGPLLLCLDDLQWADPSTLQVINYLGRQAHTRDLLVAAAYRSTEITAQKRLAALRQPLESRNILTTIELPPLNQDDVVLLLHSFGSGHRSDELARRLHQNTEGNPFFLTEVLHTFIQEGLITTDSAGRWQTDYDEVTDSYRELLLPPSVRTAALGRLERLGSLDRALLELGAVIGRGFSTALMTRLLERREGELSERLDWLAARGFLRPSPAANYEFSHELTRRAVYEALSEPRCKLLHRQVAEIMLADLPSGSGESGDIAGRVATHFAASDRPWLALEHALAAADHAVQVIAYDEAIAWCQLATRIAGTHSMAVPPGFRTRLHLQCRTLWYYRGDLERTLAASRAALAAARQEEDTTAELQALLHLAHDETQVAAGGPSGAQQQALELARQVGDPAALSRSLARIGSDLGFQASPHEREEALAYLQRAVDLAREVNDHALLHHVLSEWWGVGRLPRAREALEEALALVQRLADPREEAGTLAKLSDLLVRQGDFTAAVAYAEAGLNLAQQVDSPPYAAWNRRALGQALVALGSAEDGIAHIVSAAATFESHAWRAMLNGTLLRLGLALSNLDGLDFGNLDGSVLSYVEEPVLSCVEGVTPRSSVDEKRAVEALERVLVLSHETREPWEAAYALAILGRIRLQGGDGATGRQALEEAASLAPRIGLPWHRGGTLAQVATGRLIAGEINAALVAADEVVHLAEAEHLREPQAHGLLLRAKALGALGCPDEARVDLLAGLELAEVMGHIALQRQLRRLLSASRAL